MYTTQQLEHQQYWKAVREELLNLQRCAASWIPFSSCGQSAVKPWTSNLNVTPGHSVTIQD